MTFPPNNPNGLYVATQAMQMGKNAGEQEAKMFNRIAMASMIAVTGTTLIQLALPAVEKIIALLYPPKHAEKVRKERDTEHHRER